MRNLWTLILVGGALTAALGEGFYSGYADLEEATSELGAGTFDLVFLEPGTNSATETLTYSFTNLYPGWSMQNTIRLDLKSRGTLLPDHVELQIGEVSFTDATLESGGQNTVDELLAQVEVKELRFAGSGLEGDLLSCVQAMDGVDPAFVTLADVKAYGVFDRDREASCGALGELRMGTSAYLTFHLAMPQDLPDADDNRYQGDGVALGFNFGIAQVSGQSVL